MKLSAILFGTVAALALSACAAQDGATRTALQGPGAAYYGGTGAPAWASGSTLGQFPGRETAIPARRGSV